MVRSQQPSPAIRTTRHSPIAKKNTAKNNTLRERLKGMTFMQAKTAAKGLRIKYNNDEYEIVDVDTREMCEGKVMKAWDFSCELVHSEKQKQPPSEPLLSGDRLLNSPIV